MMSVTIDDLKKLTDKLIIISFGDDASNKYIQNVKDAIENGEVVVVSVKTPVGKHIAEAFNLKKPVIATVEVEGDRAVACIMEVESKNTYCKEITPAKRE